MSKLFFLAVFLSIVPFSAHAEFSLSITSSEGMNSLRFPRAVDKPTSIEARVRINSSSQRYQLKQRLLEDFRNNRGETLATGAISSYALNGSNLHGSLYQNVPTRLDATDRVLYVSSPQGDNDSFVMVYQVDPTLVNTSGDFVGRVAFTLQPVGSGANEQTLVLTCYVTIDKKTQVSISTSSNNPRMLRFEKKDQSSYEGCASIAIDGNLGQQFRIIQTMHEPLRNDQGEALPINFLSYLVQCKNGQSHISAYTPITERPMKAYTSNTQGDSDTVMFMYRIDDKGLSNLSQGEYRGNITFDIDTNQGTLQQLPLEIIHRVSPTFDISVASETNSGLRFESIQPGVAIEKEITLTVNSNMRRPYAMLQKITTPLVNERGNTIDVSNIKVSGRCDQDMPGTVLVNASTPVKNGDMTVFTSDPQGRSSKIILRYSLDVPKNSKAGNYYTDISFALVEK